VQGARVPAFGSGVTASTELRTIQERVPISKYISVANVSIDAERQWNWRGKVASDREFSSCAENSQRIYASAYLKGEICTSLDHHIFGLFQYVWLFCELRSSIYRYGAHHYGLFDITGGRMPRINEENVDRSIIAIGAWFSGRRWDIPRITYRAVDSYLSKAR
jgi:hypothetical protein